MLAEGQQGIFGIVLGTYRQQRSGARERLQVALEGHERLANRAAAQLDAREAVLANYSAPKHAVQIQRQALGGEAQNRAQQGGELVAQRRHGFRRWVLLGRIPQHRIVPAVFAEARRDLVHIQNRHALGAPGGFPKRQVDGAQQAAASSGQSRTQVAQGVERRRLIVELNDGGAQTLSGFPPQRFEPDHVLANNTAG